jgi:hypothetical protein
MLLVTFVKLCAPSVLCCISPRRGGVGRITGSKDSRESDESGYKYLRAAKRWIFVRAQ